MASSATNRLPAELTSFVGRQHDLDAVRQLLSTTRLVTLTGPGGVGKTRLALRVGADLERRFPDGIHLVELGSLGDPALLGHAVIDALEIRAPGTTDPTAALCTSLHDREALLILDGCEHVVTEAAELTASLLLKAPGLRVLATSRQSLNVTGEHIHPVGPLELPEAASDHSPMPMTDVPAIRLFADRTASVVPGFEVTRENADAVVRLCRRLEGIPLAIELAAVRLRVLTVDELLARLDDRFAMLRSDIRNLPHRHRTLKALFDWSFDLCSPSEQLLWLRASVFAGSFSIDALTEVCADDTLPGGEDLLDTLVGLVEKSILIREAHGAQVRFRMLDTIREYGHRRLEETGDAAAFARRQRDWCAHLIERVSEEWSGPGQEKWATRFQPDQANVRVALEYCMATPGEVHTGLRMVGHLWFWAALDHVHEASVWLDRGLALDRRPSPECAWALAVRAYIAGVQGDPELLGALAEEAITMARGLGDRPALALAHQVLACRHALSHGDTVRQAIPLFREALRRYDDLGPDMAQYVDSLLVELAATHLQLRDFDEAAELIDELWQRCRTSGDRWNLSYAMWLRGRLSLAQGDAERAEADLLDALRIKRIFRDTIGLALTFEVLAWTTATLGDYERAATLMSATDRAWREVGAAGLQMHGKRAPHVGAARAVLGGERMDAAWTRGERFSVDDTVRYALREVPEAPPPSPDPAERLTRREHEVAVLVAQGLSNREIAARLVISQRTAEGHVERVLAKLGFRARAQIASWIASHEPARSS